MKRFILFLAFISVALIASGQVADPEPIKWSWNFIIYVGVAVIAGIYEILVRLIPTVGNYSWLGKIIDVLKWLSDFLNRKKKK